MTDVITVIAEMSWWVKSAWLVWLVWVALQVAWYRWGHLASSDTVAPAPPVPVRIDVSRFAPIDTKAHPPADAGHEISSSSRRRRRARRAAAVTPDLADGVEAAR
jgi:hypothetical protein